MPKFFATCAGALEPILKREVDALEGVKNVEIGRGGVSFDGPPEMVYKASLWLRTAVRILQPILDVEVFSPDDLYDAVRTINWQNYLTPQHTLAVDCNVRDSAITHSLFASLRTKDAICDQFIDRIGIRPSVDADNPMVGLNLHIYRNRAILSLDASWDSLHKRGYRPILVRAPLNEALAAAIILGSGWDRKTPFLDPMCGSAVLPIEASWIALNRPPGLTRRHFAFQGWMDFNIGKWAQIRDDAREAMKTVLPAPISGSDIRRDAVEFARTNSKSAGVGHLLGFEQKDIRQVRLDDIEPGTIIMNPPYGERIGEEEDLRPTYEAIGDFIRGPAAEWKVLVFTGNPEMLQHIGPQRNKVIHLRNGPINCRLGFYAKAGLPDAASGGGREAEAVE